MKNETLSDNIYSMYDAGEELQMIHVHDVKEFIKELKAEFKRLHDNENSIFSTDEYSHLNKFLHELAGEKLI